MSQNKPPLFVVDGGETLFILGAFHHETLLYGDITPFRIRLPILPRHSREVEGTHPEIKNYFIIIQTCF